MEKKDIIYSKNPELVSKENEGKLLLFNVNSGVMFELNESANLLWTKSNDTFRYDELFKIMEEVYGNNKEIGSDVKEFIKTALEENLINQE